VTPLPLRVRRRAELDLDEAYEWYEARSEGLGEAFLRAVSACFARISSHPEAFPEVEHRVRRARLRRFPYGVFYVLRGEAIDVLAVYHSRRRPRRFDP
jgi:toxin ParE1/3/4